jgi:ATP adenylyltransferase
MSHEQLWAPWRLAYVQDSQDKPEGATPRQVQEVVLPEGADPKCFICRAAASDADRENLVIRRVGQTIVILNRYPYNNGHLLIAPVRHAGQFEDITSDEHVEIAACMARLLEDIRATMNPDGFNVGLNLGRVAGAGLPGHLHWHIVPRWDGDTNFMPVLAGIKVIPQSLDALWELLHQ